MMMPHNTPRPKQPHPDDLNVSTGEWDHNFEVCAHETGCSAHDFACVNIFSLALLSDDPSDNGGPVRQLSPEFSHPPAPAPNPPPLPLHR